MTSSAAAVLMAATVTTQVDALPTRPYLPLALATAAAQAAVNQCRAHGFSISVFVLDGAGETIVAMRGDDARPHHFASARRKAYTALTFRMPSGELAAFIARNPQAAALGDMEEVIALGGGLPIMSGTAVVGGIGVAGGQNSDEGEACARAGLAAIAAELN